MKRSAIRLNLRGAASGASIASQQREQDTEIDTTVPKGTFLVKTLTANGEASESSTPLWLRSRLVTAVSRQSWSVTSLVTRLITAAFVGRWAAARGVVQAPWLRRCRGAMPNRFCNVAATRGWTPHPQQRRSSPAERHCRSQHAAPNHRIADNESVVRDLDNPGHCCSQHAAVLLCSHTAGGGERCHSRQSDSLTTTNTGHVTLSLRYVLVSGSSESPSASLNLGHLSPAAGRPPAPVSTPISPREAAAPTRPKFAAAVPPGGSFLYVSGRQPPISPLLS